MAHCYLRVGDDALEQAKPHATISGAVSSYRRQAESLARHGQGLSASIHIARSREEVAKYPDYVLNYDADKECVIRERA